MRWLAPLSLLLFLVKAEDWEDTLEDTAKEGRWLVRRKRAAEKELDIPVPDEDGDKYEDADEDPEPLEEGDSEGEIVPKEKVSLIKGFIHSILLGFRFLGSFQGL